MVDTFRNTWDSIVDTLTDYSSEITPDALSIEAGTVKVGDDGKLTIATPKAPFLVVLAIPDESNVYENNARDRRLMDVGIIAGIGPQASTVESLNLVIELLEGVEWVINKYLTRKVITERSIDLISLRADSTRASFNFKVQYASSANGNQGD